MLGDIQKDMGLMQKRLKAVESKPLVEPRASSSAALQQVQSLVGKGPQRRSEVNLTRRSPKASSRGDPSEDDEEATLPSASRTSTTS